MAAARATPAKPALPLERYAGRYGMVTISVEDGHLVAAARQTTRLLPLTPDLFAADIDPTVQMRFTVDKGETTAIEIQPLDGPPTRTPKG